MSDLQPADPEFFTSRLLAWFGEHGRGFPWRQTDDPYRILICEVLLRRSRSTTVAKVTGQFFDLWPTPAHLAEADADEVVAVIRPLGLTGRASQLIALARSLSDLSTFPSSVDELMDFPGVGRYAAAATLGKPTVDGTSARVYRRYFGQLGVRDHKWVDEELWELATRVLSGGPEKAREVNWAVLDLASFKCLPFRPRCEECPLRAACYWATSVSGPNLEPSATW